MYFSKLSKDVQDAIKLLCSDKVFQDRFGHDSELDKLDEEKLDKSTCLKELSLMMFRRCFIGQRSFNALTPKLWSFLWCIDSPITTDKEIGMPDLDIFFFILENGIENSNPLDIVKNAIGQCEKNGLNYDEAFKICSSIIDMAFKPLAFFPQTQHMQGKKQVEFSVDWLTTMISRVHQVSGLSPDEICNLPLNTCCFYYIQYARMNSTQQIQRRPPEEILDAQDARSCELILDRLEELGVTKPEDRKALYDIMRTPPE